MGFFSLLRIKLLYLRNIYKIVSQIDQLERQKDRGILINLNKCTVLCGGVN